MRALFLALLLSVSTSAFATGGVACSLAPCTADIVPGTNNLSGSYTTSYPQQVFVSLPVGLSKLQIVNENTNAGVCCEVSTGNATTVPVSGNNHELCVAAAGATPGPFRAYWLFLNVGAASVYCRSGGSAITSGGTIHVQLW